MASNKTPWQQPETFAWLESILQKDFYVFEYGSGASTIYFCEKVKWVGSVENVKSWFDEVSRDIKNYNLLNIDYFFKPDSGDADPKFKNDPVDYSSTSGLFGGKNFEDYVKTIDMYPNETFDLVMVDGRSRVSCLKHAQDKVKVGGFVLLDDTDRDYYNVGKNFYNESSKWEHKTLCSYSCIWRRLN